MYLEQTGTSPLASEHQQARDLVSRAEAGGIRMCNQRGPRSRFHCTRIAGHDAPNSSDDLRHLAGYGVDRYSAQWDNDRSTD